LSRWVGKVKKHGGCFALLRGLFLLLKAFLQSPVKKFVVLIHSREDTETLGRLLAEGMLGLFLSAAQEHPSVQFRTLEIDRIPTFALRCAVLWTGEAPWWRSFIVMEGSSLRRGAWPRRSSGFVKSESGPWRCCRHVWGRDRDHAHLARCLVPFTPRLVFLGRPLSRAGKLTPLPPLC